MTTYEVTAKSGLKIRQKPSGFAKVLWRMPNGMHVRASGADVSDEDWVGIIVDLSPTQTLEGFSAAKYLRELPEEAQPEAPAPTHVAVPAAPSEPRYVPEIERLYRVNASSLRLRDAPSTSGQIIYNMQDGNIVEKLADAPNLWWKVVANVEGERIEGYAHGDYLAALRPDPAPYSDFTRLSNLADTLQDVKRFVGDYASGLQEPVLGQLKSILNRYGILASPLRFSHFMAQVAHESHKFRYTEELLNYSAERLVEVFPGRFPTIEAATPYARNPQAFANKVYANRIGNGDEASGDGYRYRGRGFIQLTGRSNYRDIGTIIGRDLENDPDILVRDPIVALDAAGAFWVSRNINEAADRDDLERVTRLVNGGYNGLEDRRGYLLTAKSIWGDKTTA